MSLRCQGEEAETWRGMVVVAVDGSRVEIPNSAENRRVYGASENQYRQAVARANFSGMYDAHNHFFLDAGVWTFTSSELEEEGTVRGGSRAALAQRVSPQTPPVQNHNFFSID